MTTRSGRGYKRQEMDIDTAAEANALDRGVDADDRVIATDSERREPRSNTDITALVEMLMQDRRRREEEIAEDRARREREMERRVVEMKEQMEAMCRLMEHSGRSKAHAGEALVKVAKLTDSDDIEGYLLTIAQQSRTKTAFTTPFGLFQFTVMPFGLHGAPATFQRMMDVLLSGAGEYSAAYLDDLVVFSSSWPEHLGHLRAVLQRLREAGLTAKPTKCHIAMNQCVYLGHKVGNGEIEPETSKIKAVSDFPQPETKKDVRAFLGLTGYYRKFIPNYATIALPLTDLTKKSLPNAVEWTTACDTAFTELKRRLVSTPVLKSPDFSKQFILQTDASERGIGAVLSQRTSTGEEHPIAYYSRKLLPREERYATVEKECLAIKLGIQAFRVYLLGRRFLVQTDHRSLEWLHRLKENNARLTRWSLSLQPYMFTVEHRAGKDNTNADGLSRGAIRQY